MKKILKSMLAIVLTASMLFVLSGCGNKEEEKATNDNEKTNIEQENRTVEFSMGSWSDNVYSNDFLGLKFKLPNGWKYSSDEELAENLNNGLELFNEDQREMVENALKTRGIYYLQAIDPTTNNNVLVFTEQVPEGTSEEYYLEQVGKGLSAMESVNYNVGEIEKEIVSNKEYTTLQEEISDYGVLQKHFIYKKDNYIVGIIITSTTGEHTFSEVMKNFE